MEDLKQLRMELTEHYGAINEIAQRAGVSRKTVTEMLRGYGRRKDVLVIAAQVLKERNDKKAVVDKHLSQQMEEIKQRQADLFSQPN